MKTNSKFKKIKINKKTKNKTLRNTNKNDQKNVETKRLTYYHIISLFKALHVEDRLCLKMTTLIIYTIPMFFPHSNSANTPTIGVCVHFNNRV